DQPRHDESAVGNAVHRGHARPDRGAEDHEIERGGDHGRYHALEQRTKSPRHLELVDGPYTVPVECQWVRSRPHLRSLTKLTKMSSRELWRVFRSLKPMPRSLKRLSKVGIPVRSSWPSKVYSSSHPPAFSAKRQSLSSRGIDASGSSRLSVSCFLPSFFISSIFSSTTISSPLLITPIRSAISSASSMWWGVRVMVPPLSRRPRTSADISRRSSTSTPAVGSSGERISGSCPGA